MTRVSESMRAALEAFELMDSVEPPPSSNGPRALRGDDLIRALAAATAPPGV